MQELRIKLVHLAKECLAAANGAWEAAAEKMRRKRDRDAVLREELLRLLLDGAIWDLMRHASRLARWWGSRASSPRRSSRHSPGSSRSGRFLPETWEGGSVQVVRSLEEALRAIGAEGVSQ